MSAPDLWAVVDSGGYVVSDCNRVLLVFAEQWRAVARAVSMNAAEPSVRPGESLFNVARLRVVRRAEGLRALAPVDGGTR